MVHNAVEETGGEGHGQGCPATHQPGSWAPWALITQMHGAITSSEPQHGSKAHEMTEGLRAAWEGSGLRPPPLTAPAPTPAPGSKCNRDLNHLCTLVIQGEFKPGMRDER